MFHSNKTLEKMLNREVEIFNRIYQEISMSSPHFVMNCLKLYRLSIRIKNIRNTLNKKIKKEAKRQLEKYNEQIQKTY